MRKPLIVLAIAACLIMSVVGGFIPILQGWIFFVIALYLLATEFETGRVWVKRARGRWPWLNLWIVRARQHKWAPRHLKEFEDLTDPWGPDEGKRDQEPKPR
ncbi:MAG: hypothetical protein IBJ17_03685 [Reyranella sp.]|nr:hypothetical protein [Reyranella sp.]